MRQLLLAALLCASAAIYAQEKITLSSPVFVSQGATDFRVWQLVLKRADADDPVNNDASIRATFREVSGTAFITNGRTLTCSYSGQAAENKIIALNKMNFSTTTLEHVIIAQCQADGLLGAGTISGTAGH